jgi:hypothetical protein
MSNDRQNRSDKSVDLPVRRLFTPEDPVDDRLNAIERDEGEAGARVIARRALRAKRDPATEQSRGVPGGPAARRPVSREPVPVLAEQPRR